MRTRSLALLGAVTLSLPLSATAVAASADSDLPPPPISVQPLTPRSSVPDDVSLRVKVRDHHGTSVVHVHEPSRVVVTKITVQPGARFPWHTHPGPVLVTVAEGELTYVDAATCAQRRYPAGTAFFDTGDDVHSAYGSAGGATLYATFFAAPETGPLTVPEADQRICS